MRDAAIRTLKFSGAIIFILLGLAGLVLPIIPGLLFLAIGLIWLGVVEKEDMHAVAERIKKRFSRR